MAKKKPDVRSMTEVMMLSCSFTSKGVRYDVPPVNYKRVETSDGKVEEHGLPAGCKPGASLSEIFGAAVAGVKRTTRKTTKGRR